MHLSENEGIEGKAFVVTGGLGFVGSSLCLELIRRGARLVRAFDCRSNSPWSHLLLNNKVHLLKGDIINRKDVDKALRGVDCVFHLASFGMSGKEMLQYGRVDDVNINGTCHVLEACHQNDVKRLVYASTSNVVFAGNEIVNGNEKLPYVPLDNHVDPYSRSKSIAEQLVLKSNGRPLKDKNGECLYTCAVRPAAIYGPGEERHLPRIINLAKLGLLPFKIGEPNVKSDWVYIDNLVLALILASMGLLDDIPGRGKQPVAAGQPYFISDGSPVNTFEFLLPLLKGLEYDMPKATLPVSTALFVGKVFSVIYTVMYPWLNRNWLPQPLLLPAEVYKVGVTHYFNYLKAKQELGYTPITSPQEGMAATISFYQERKRKSLDGPTIYEWFFCVFGMSAVIGAAFFPVPILRPACLFIIRSLWALRVLAIWAIAMHVGESIYAWRLAKRVDPANARGWFLQTFLLGIFSLKFLLKRAKQLGYTPITSPQEGMAATISFYQERKRESLDGPTIYEWFFCVFGVWAVIGAAFFPVPILRPACLFIIRSLWALRVLAISVIAAHVGESIYAWRLAKRVDPANSRGWALQTFVLGIFSLKFLLKRAKK